MSNVEDIIPIALAAKGIRATPSPTARATGSLMQEYQKMHLKRLIGNQMAMLSMAGEGKIMIHTEEDGWIYDEASFKKYSVSPRYVRQTTKGILSQLDKADLNYAGPLICLIEGLGEIQRMPGNRFRLHLSYSW